MCAALAQGKKNVAPPPKPADEGPSLEVTMKFMEDKLNDVGALNLVVYSQGEAVGKEIFHLFFPFFEEQLANRVAKAMVHAVELCGGGGPPEPF